MDMRISGILSFSVSFIVFLIVTDSYAKNFNAIITSKNPLMIREITDKKMYYFDVGSKKGMGTFLKKLKIGDFISFEGSQDDISKRIKFFSINFVGLKDLIGIWYNTEKQICIDIQSFTNLTLYSSPTATGCTISNTNSLKNLSYTVNPEIKNQWVALVTEEETTFLADFSFTSSSELQLTISNANTNDQDIMYVLKKVSK